MPIAARIFAALIALTVALGAGSATPSVADVADVGGAAATAVVIRLDGQVNDYARDQLFKRFAIARQLGAHDIILEIDTYGGAVTSGLEISQFLKRQTDLHIVAFIPEKAISAGAMIALAADEIVMGPSAKLGDSAPIAIDPSGGLQPLPAAERAKSESPILADFHESALRNGYDPLLAASMVAVGRSVHWVVNDAGAKRFVDEGEYAKLIQQGWRPVAGVPDPVDGPDTLLTVHADLAVKLGLAKSIAASAGALAAARHWTIIETLGDTAGDRLVGLLGSPAARSILLIVFIMALSTALHTPGHGAPEAFAAVSLGLLVGVPLLTGYAQWWEIFAILLGMVLLALEIFVIPGFGVAGIGGLILLLGGLVMTFVPAEPTGIPGFLPTLAGTWTAMQTGLLVVFGGMLASAGLWMWISRYLPALPYFNRLILGATTGAVATGPTDPTRDPADDFPAIGATGSAVTDLRPGGTIEIADEPAGLTRRLDAVCDSGFVPAGAGVVVRERRGGYVLVRQTGERS